MASPPFPVEDHTDEDFFDKLVDDEADGAGSELGFRENVETNDSHAFAKLSIKEVGTPLDGSDSMQSVREDLDQKDDTTSCENDGKVENVGVEDGASVIESSELVDPKNVTELSDHAVDAEYAGGGIKEVQWSAFGSGPGEASYSDFFNEISNNSADPFGEVAGEFAVASDTALGVSSNQVNCSSSYNSVQNEENLHHDASTAHNTEMQERSSSQYWENLYPGWKYDPNNGQWYQLDGPDAMVNNTVNSDASVQSTSDGAAMDPKSDVYYLQQTARSVAGSMLEESKTGTLSYWNQTTQGNTEYPAHMVFDPQYPGWYYDTIALEWRSLDSYASSVNQSTNLHQYQQMSNASFATGSYYSEHNMGYGRDEQVNSYSQQQDQLVNWRDSGNNHHQQDMNMVQSEPFGKSETIGSTQHTYFGNGYMSSGQIDYSADLKTGVTPSEKSALYEETSRGFDSSDGNNRFQGFSNGFSGFHNFAPAEKFSQHSNQRNMEFDQQFSSANFNGPKMLNFSQQPLQNNGQSPYQSPYASSEGRSSAGRPPHALVAFGFGGKLIVMKNQSTLHTQSAYVSQDSAGGVINILNMMEVAIMKSDGTDVGFGACDYFRTLCQHSIPGPLVSGNVGSKELNKWIDERIVNCGIPDSDYRKGEAMKMLFSLLKIACHYYGKVRSAFGTDLGLKENDCPESALSKLFASAKRNGTQFSAITHCLQNMPSEGQTQATADEVQMLLVSGRRMEALQCAKEGHLWGPAIVIAALLGEQFYGETVKQMALHQLVAGSPLRTLCLLLAGQPAEVFSNLVTTNTPNGVNVSQPTQAGLSCMLDEWEDNLAIITANRTKGDELVIIHLGDCLWKDRSEVTAAHICYLVAEANVESYSESARLCLVGADHLKYPRTFATPEAIQRTELYEYAKVIGNSQFILLPFQPYKIIYATMLAEVGKLSDSLKYCQAVLKSLKAGRSPEVDAWRCIASSLEERIKIHLQGGYATNLAPAKLVGKLLNFFDNTAHRVVGGLPPPVPSTSHSNSQRSEHDHQSRGPRVLTSQSTMAMSSLMPSASMDGNTRKSLHNRSVSEPDIGRTPRKVESPEKSNSSSPHASTSVPGGSSRFGRFGSQIFQKTVGLVLRSRPDRQAKLGEKNKFYYDENLKRWVEEGAAPPAEEPALAPPPTAASFMNGTPDHDKKGESSVNGNVHANGEPEFKSPNSVEKSAGTPPIPFSSNQLSARGRMGVRARYVDTFNKGGGYQANLFQSPSPSVQGPALTTSKAKFFIPTPVAGGQETDSTSSPQEAEDATTSNQNQSFSSPHMLTPQPTIHRHPSMEHIPSPGMGGMMNGNGPPPAHSRRTLSWSGGLGDPSNHSSFREARPLGEALGFPPPMPFSSNCTTVAENLQEVEL